jgi:hypothetical protein
MRDFLSKPKYERNVFGGRNIITGGGTLENQQKIE